MPPGQPPYEGDLRPRGSPPVVPAFAYRFDGPERSIVISGDTAPSMNLVKLANGADVLVHSALYPGGIDRLVARVPNAEKLKASILAHQTSAEQAGRIAQDAGVKVPCCNLEECGGMNLWWITSIS